MEDMKSKEMQSRAVAGVDPVRGWVPTQPSVRQEWRPRRFRYVRRAKNEKSGVLVLVAFVVGLVGGGFTFKWGVVWTLVWPPAGGIRYRRFGCRPEAQTPENRAKLFEAAGTGRTNRADTDIEPRRNQRVIRFSGGREECFEEIAAFATEPLQRLANKLPFGEPREIGGADAFI